MVTPRRLAAVIDRQRVALCLSLSQARTPDIVLIAAASGFDAVYVDLEHSVTPLDTASMICSTALGAGLVPFVRVPSLQGATITRVLDGGALGIIVPHIETPDQARAIVDACRFPPLGRRTLYGATPVTGYRQLPHDDLVAALDDDVVVVPMIESALGVTNAAKIAGTDGVDLLLVGVHDLSADLGVPGQTDHVAVREALHAVGDACRSQGKWFGVAGVGDATRLTDLVDRGLCFISAGTDAGLLQQAATARVKLLRELSAPTTSDPDD